MWCDGSFSLRTARGFDYGTALSLVSQEEEGRLADVEERLQREAGGAVAATKYN